MPSLRLPWLTHSIFALCAMLCCRAALAETPRQLVERGIAFSNQRLHEDAIRTFERVRQRAPELTRVLLLLGTSHLQLGHLDEALRCYESFHRADRATDADAQALLRDGYAALAERLAQQYERTPQRIEALLGAGRAAYRLGQLERAGSLYHRYLQAAASSVLNDREREGRDQYLREYHEEVLRRVPARLESEPDHPELLLLLGESFLALEQNEAALAMLDRYREHSGRRSEEQAYRLSTGYKQLLRRFSRPSGEDVLLRGRAHFGLHQLEAAAAHYSLYRELTPTLLPRLAASLGRYEAELLALKAQEAAERLRIEAANRVLRLPKQVTSVQLHAAARRPAAAQLARTSRWLLGSGGLAIGLGAGLVGLGITALAYDGRCVNDELQPCAEIYASRNLGLGTTLAGSLLIIGGATAVGVGAIRSKSIDVYTAPLD